MIPLFGKAISVIANKQWHLHPIKKNMKKAFCFILLVIIVNTSYAQLGALKAKKDAAAANMAEESSKNTVKTVSFFSTVP